MPDLDVEALQKKKSAALLRHFVQNFKNKRKYKYSRDTGKVLSILRNGEENDPKSQKTLKDWKFLSAFENQTTERHFKYLLRILKFKHFQQVAREQLGNSSEQKEA